jgi:phage terminase small subunit
MRSHPDKEKLFVDAYLANGRVGTKAVIAAGYSHKAAKVQASKLLRRPHIQAAIAEHDKKIVTSIKKSVKGSASWKRRKLIKIADILSSSGIDAKSAKSVIGAIAELNKMDGHYSAEKVVNHNYNADTDIETLKSETAKQEEILAKHRKEF